MSTLQINRRERENYQNYQINKENENYLNIARVPQEIDRNKKNSRVNQLDHISSESLHNYLDSVALELRGMGAKIHPINFQTYRNETQLKNFFERRKNSAKEFTKNLKKSHSEKYLLKCLRRFDSCSKLNKKKEIETDDPIESHTESITIGESEKNLIRDILIARENSAIIIQKFFRKSHAQKKAKLVYLLERIIIRRKTALLKLQSHVKGYICRKNIRQIIKMKQENYLIFFYKKKIGSFSKFQIEELFMIVKQEKYNQVLNFKYNRFLDCFILFIKKNDSYKPKYKIIFTINGQKIVDTGFEIGYGEDGSCYNILDFNILRKKGYVSNLEEIKENLSIPMKGQRKLTPDTLPTISEENLENELKMLRPCIKKSSDCVYHHIIPKKKVSFNLKMNNFY